MNQSLALLYKIPVLAEELHDDIRKLVSPLRAVRFQGQTLTLLKKKNSFFFSLLNF